MAYPGKLEQQVPTGNPEAHTCRWCGSPRYVHRGQAIGCKVCDLLTRWPRRTP